MNSMNNTAKTSTTFFELEQDAIKQARKNNSIIANEYGVDGLVRHLSFWIVIPGPATAYGDENWAVMPLDEARDAGHIGEDDPYVLYF
jgi:hypothetical protein